MDSSDVNKRLRADVWPALRDHGFDRRSSRTAWRDQPDQVDVINFQSFNAYNARVLNITTYSFQINLGVHPRCLTTDAIPSKDGLLRPLEYHCDFRYSLTGPFKAPGTTRGTLWRIDEHGSNLAEVVDQARAALLADGLWWFEALSGLDALLRTARESPENMDEVWGMGNIGSPHRLDLVKRLERASRRSSGID